MIKEGKRSDLPALAIYPVIRSVNYICILHP